MSDVNAKIGVQIDTSQALAELKSLQRQLALFHTSVAKGSASAAAQQRNMQQNLLNSINATGKFSAQMGVVRTSTESFTMPLKKTNSQCESISVMQVHLQKHLVDYLNLNLTQLAR
jgi:hypothetical protein